MFKIIENYKQLFSLCVKNALDYGDPYINDQLKTHKVTEEKSVSDLINSIKIDGKIDEKDLKNLTILEEKLNQDKSEVTEFTKSKLKEAYTETLSNGFEVKNENGYNVLKILLSKIDSNIQMPEYSAFSFTDKSFTVVYDKGKLKVYDDTSFSTGLGNNTSFVGLISNGKFVADLYSLGLNANFNDNDFDFSKEPKQEHQKTAQESVKEEQDKIDINKQEQEQAQKILEVLSNKQGELEQPPIQSDKPEKSIKELMELEDAEKLNEAKKYYRNMGVPSEKIEEIQKILASTYKIKVDRKFGKNTFDAISSFQKTKNLKIDGKAGTQTLKHLGLIKEGQTSKDFYSTQSTNGKYEIKYTSIPPSEPIYDVERGTTNPAVIEQKIENDGENINEVNNKELDEMRPGELSEKMKNIVNISGEKVIVENDGENTNKLTIVDVQSPTVITGVPKGKETEVINKYKDSIISFIDFGESHTYEEFMGNNEK